MGMKPNIMKEITNEYQQTCHSDMSQAAQKVNPSEKKVKEKYSSLAQNFVVTKKNEDLQDYS